MKMSDLFKYSFLKTVRNRKNKFFVLVISILSILLISILNYETAFLKDIDRKFIFSPDFRSLLVDPNVEELNKHWDESDYDYGYDDILNLDHVQDIYYFPLDNYYGGVTSFKNDIYDGKIELLYGSSAIMPKLTAGEMFEEDATGVAICSNYFFPSTEYDGSLKIEKGILYEDDILNKTFSMEADIVQYDNGSKVVGKYSKNFKIVGLFDTFESTFNDLSVCYISPNDMEEIYNASVRELNNPNVSRSFSYAVVVDDYSNIQSVAEELKKMGFIVSPKGGVDYEYVSKLKRVCFIIIVLILLSIIAISVLYVKKKINSDLFESGLSLALGYSKHQVIIINMIQVMYLSIISTVIGMLLYKSILVVLTTIFKELFLLNGLYIFLNDYLYNYAICVVITIFIPIILSVILNKLHLNNKLINLIRNDKE